MVVPYCLCKEGNGACVHIYIWNTKKPCWFHLYHHNFVPSLLIFLKTKNIYVVLPRHACLNK